MAYLNHEQENFLIKFVEHQIKTNPLAEHSQEMLRLDIAGALHKHAWREIIIEDIEMVAENHDVNLTDEQLSNVVSIVSNYDYEDYNEYISYAIDKVLEDEEDEDNET